MKRIEDIILESSSEVKAKLFGPAQIAYQNPETGVTITKPSAFRVIKDCAETALLFLPIEVFLKYKSPISSLKGKFNRENVGDLYSRSQNDSVTRVLLNLILDTCPKSPSTILPSNALKAQINSDDPYGEYGDSGSHTTVENKSLVDIILSIYG
jgi:hypothetical protein